MKSWASRSSWYSRLRHVPPFNLIYRQELAHCRELLNSQSFSRDIALDVGTGTGDSLALYDTFQSVMALDLSLPMIAQAPHKNGFSPVVGDAGRLPVLSRSISLVSALGLTEYLNDLDGFFAEARRVLKPEGLLLATRTPVNLLSRCRSILGPSLRMRLREDWMFHAAIHGFRLLKMRRSFMQEQYLFQKE